MNSNKPLLVEPGLDSAILAKQRNGMKENMISRVDSQGNIKQVNPDNSSNSRLTLEQVIDNEKDDQPANFFGKAFLPSNNNRR